MKIECEKGSFEWALHKMKRGFHVKRSCFLDDVVLYIDCENAIIRLHDYGDPTEIIVDYFEQSAIFALDWEVDKRHSMGRFTGKGNKSNEKTNTD